jgi:DNA-directed RNA polymerase subunit RPC12/RpoP
MAARSCSWTCFGSSTAKGPDSSGANCSLHIGAEIQIVWPTTRLRTLRTVKITWLTQLFSVSRYMDDTRTADTVTVPQTLMEVIKHFSDPLTCVNFMAKLRWEDGPVCPRCALKRLSFLPTRLMWKCLDCKKQFSVKAGTIFEDSPIGLDKWLVQCG